MIETRPGWNLLVPQSEAEQVTKGGLVVPDAPLQASPIGIGKVIMGGFVMYQKNAGQIIHYKGSSYLLVPDSAIVADVVD